MTKLVAGKLGSNLRAVAVVMAGGSGTRFWPLSRKARPKQYLPLAEDNKTLIQATAERVLPVVGEQGVMVVTSAEQAGLVLEQLPNACVVMEPCPRNTAPCVALGARYVLETVGDVPMICLPADHLVTNVDALLGVYQEAVDLAAKEDVLITIGIRPTAPETGYGYILRGETYAKQVEDKGNGAYFVKQFVEKPSLKKAQEYLASGDYFWNSGMFIWRPSVILKSIQQLLPDLAEGIGSLEADFESSSAFATCSEVYSAVKPVSIDVGVLEKADNVLMMSGDGFHWSDIGSWGSWSEIIREGGAGSENYIKGQSALVDCSGCTVVGGKRLIAGVGLQNLVVVDTDDCILICQTDKSQDVKKLVDQIKESKYKNLL